MKIKNIISHFTKAALAAAFTGCVSSATAQVYSGTGFSMTTLSDDKVVTLNGTYKTTITIADGVTVTLDNATITQGIRCLGNATIILEGDNKVNNDDQPNKAYHYAGIEIGPENTTLTIKGDGNLECNSSSSGAGIGTAGCYLSSGRGNRNGGNIVIESGNITAKSGYANGIGCGCTNDSYYTKMGDIIIKGGTINSFGGENTPIVGFYSIGAYDKNSTVGSIIIYDDVEMLYLKGYEHYEWIDSYAFNGNVVYMFGDEDVTNNKDTYFTESITGDYKIIKPNYVVFVADEISHGTVIANPNHVTKGDNATITLTVTPDKGYSTSTVSYNDGSDHSLTSTDDVYSFSMPSAHVTVLATFLAIEYTITYNGTDGATFATANPPTYTIESDEITLVNPTRDGYTFLGWTYEGQDEPIKNVTIPKGSTGNKEFVANWQQKFGALTLVYAGDRTTATIQGKFTSTETTSLNIENQIEVNELTFQRTFKAGVPATIMLPFDFTPDDNVGKFYTLASVAPINGVWTATMSQPITGTIQANTPYIFMPAKDITESNYMTFTDITLKPTKTINDNGSGDWTLHGVYEKTFLGDPNQVNYGFAGQATDGISVGDFIRAGEGVWADPMRCYLTYNKNNGVLAKSALDLPDNIRVVFPDEVEQSDNGEIVTPVSEFMPENGVKVWSFDGTVYIEAQPDMDYTIVDLTGRTIKKGVTHSTHEELNLNTKGIVIVKIGNKSFKLK